EQEGGQDRKGRGICQHAEIETKIEGAGGVASGLKQEVDRAGKDVAQSNAGGASEESQQPASDEVLSKEARPAGAQPQTYGRFAPAAYRVRHEQIGDIGADDQQQHSHEQHQDAESVGVSRAQRVEAAAAGQGNELGNH